MAMLRRGESIKQVPIVHEASPSPCKRCGGRHASGTQCPQEKKAKEGEHADSPR